MTRKSKRRSSILEFGNGPARVRIYTIEPTLIKKKELAKRLSVSTRSIDTWVGKRMIPYIQITPRFYLYEFEAVLAAIRKHYQVDAAQP